MRTPRHQCRRTCTVCRRQLTASTHFIYRVRVCNDCYHGNETPVSVADELRRANMARVSANLVIADQHRQLGLPVHRLP